MHNIHSLERRWVKYKIKFFLPHIIILFFAIVLIITLFFIFNSKNENKRLNEKESIQKEKYVQDYKETLEENISIKKEVAKTSIKQEKVINSTKNDEIKKENKKVVLTPSFDFMKKLRTDSIHSYDSKQVEQYTQTAIKSKEDKLDPRQEKILNKGLNTINNSQKPQIDIKMKEDRSDVEDVIKRFKKNNNPALSLFVAKKYYQYKDYQKAYNYALITNEINNEIEESWIIFAKSLVKLNKRKKAVQTLTRYVNHSGSGNAKVLLDNIKSGKFK